MDLRRQTLWLAATAAVASPPWRSSTRWRASAATCPASCACASARSTGRRWASPWRRWRSAGCAGSAIPVGVVAVGVAFAVGAVLAAYHAGVEWKWWPGPTACTGSARGAVSAASVLASLDVKQHMVRCDEAALQDRGHLAVGLERPGVRRPLPGRASGSSPEDDAVTAPQTLTLGRDAWKTRLSEMLRVDHAGELGAVHIYRGQAAVFSRARGGERMAADMAEHEGHEQVHLDAFDRILTERQRAPHRARAPVAGGGLRAGRRHRAPGREGGPRLHRGGRERDRGALRRADRRGGRPRTRRWPPSSPASATTNWPTATMRWRRARTRRRATPCCPASSGPDAGWRSG